MPDRAPHFLARAIPAVRVIAALLLVLCAASTTHAQKLSFHGYSVRDGLPSNYITYFAQDSDGYLWIATPDGIARFDGIDWRVWTTDHGLPDNYAYAIAVAPGSAKDVYIGTLRGLCRMRDGRIERVRLGVSQESNWVRDLHFDKTGTLWAATADGLYRYDNGRATRVATQDLSPSCARVLGAPDGALWVLGSTGLYRYDPRVRAGRLIDSSRGSYAGANGMHIDGDGRIFVFSRDSTILEFRDNRFYRRHDFKPVQPLSMTRDDHGHVWVATSNGLYFATSIDKLDPVAMIRYGTENGLLADGLNSAFFDREKNLWFGTEGRGMMKLEDAHIMIFDGVDLTGKGVSDRDGHVWVSSRVGLWEFWNSNNGWRRTLHTIRPDWGPRFPFHLELDHRGDLWAAFDGGGITCFDVRSKTPGGTALRVKRRVLPAPGLPVPGSFVFAIDTADRIYYGVPNHGIVIASVRGPVRLIAHLTDSSRIPLNVYSMHVDESGTVWCGGVNGKLSGITFFNEKKPSIMTIGPNDGLPPSVIRAILRRRENMWIGTSSNGFGLIEHGKVIPFTTSNGLIADRVWCFAAGHDGRIWIGTQLGLASVSEKKPKFFEYNQDLTDSPVYSCGIRPDGSLWAATRFAVTIYDYLRASKDSLAPDITITRFLVNGSDRTHRGRLALSSSENSCRIEFTCVTMRQPEDVRFEYRLEGVDTAWQQTRERSVTLAALLPGEYVFFVRSVRANGVRSAVPARIAFEIGRPFWQQAWFILVMLLLVSASVYVPLRARVTRLLEIERIRARIAADLHDDIGSGLTRIALMTEVLMRQMMSTRGTSGEKSAAPGLLEPLQRIGAISRELVDGMTDVVWSIDPRNDAFSKLMQRIKVHAVEVCEARDISLHFDVPPVPGDPSPGSDVSRALLLVAKEALQNIVKHADATQIHIRLCICERDWQLSISDNGRGFDEATLSRINGLENMRSRLRKSGGRLDITSAPGRGTHIDARLPLR